MKMNDSNASLLRAGQRFSEGGQAAGKNPIDNPSRYGQINMDRQQEAGSVPHQREPVPPNEGLKFSTILRKIGHFIFSHYKNYLNKNPWTFIWQLSLELLSFTIVVGFIVLNFFSKYNKNPFSDIPFIVILIGGLFFAPIFETFLFQSIPISITTKLRKSFAIKLLSSIVPFALVHIAQSGLIGIVSGLIGGFYFAFSYATWKERKAEYAFLITACIHFTYNMATIFFSFIYNPK